MSSIIENRDIIYPKYLVYRALRFGIWGNLGFYKVNSQIPEV